MSKARKATTYDIPALLRLAATMHKESRYAKFRLLPVKLEKVFLGLLQSRQGILFMSDHGFIAGNVEPYWFGDDLYASEYMLYVLPEWRGNGEAIALVKAYVDTAVSLGAQDVHIEDTTMIHPDKNEKFFLGMGFSKIGGNFLKEV